MPTPFRVPAPSLPSAERRLVPLRGRDPLIGGSDPARLARHPGRHPDGRQQPGLWMHGAGLVSRPAGRTAAWWWPYSLVCAASAERVCLTVTSSLAGAAGLML